MMRNLFLFLLLSSAPVFGADPVATLSWTAPAAREDGTPLTADEIGKYVIYYKTTTGYAVAAETAGNVTSWSPAKFPRTKNFVVRCVDKNGIESGDSNIAKLSFSAPTAPTVTIKVTLTP